MIESVNALKEMVRLAVADDTVQYTAEYSNTVQCMIEPATAGDYTSTISKFREMLDDSSIKLKNGHFNHVAEAESATRTIRISVECPYRRMFAVLIHEYAHIVLHSHVLYTEEQCECEAEAVAFLVCEHFNFDSIWISLAYLKRFASAMNRANLGRCMWLARSIIRNLEK